MIYNKILLSIFRLGKFRLSELGTTSLRLSRIRLSKLRLSNTGIATADGTDTITVNSVPFGYAKNDINKLAENVSSALEGSFLGNPIQFDIFSAKEILNKQLSQERI